MLVARCILALAVLVIVDGGCSTTQACCGLCPASEPAVFQLACSVTDLQSVTASGPCAIPDASLSSYAISNGVVYVQSQGPGDCHIELTFATGFTYVADVTFGAKPGGVCGGPQCTCPDYVTPSSGAFAVNNPSTTCLDAGLDDGGDAGPVACPSEASESVPCALPGSCTGCRDNAGFECTCDDAGTDAGNLQWQCTDTGFPCMPGGASRKR